MILVRILQNFTAIAGFILLACPHVVAEAHDTRPPAQSIHDLRYGETLFDFYQDRYFSAITDLLVAEKRSPITKQGDDPELLLGALYLSYGLHDAAAGIFTHLLEKNTDPITHDRAWFYLGKLDYLNGRFAEAVAAFTRITDYLSPEQEAERRHLLANAYINQDRYPDAIAVLEKEQGNDIWRAYAQYNLGIALIRTGGTEEGNRLLNQVGNMTPQDDEGYALRDKANTALGYAALRAGNAAEAAGDFSRVSLTSPYTDKALLGLGLAYSNQQRHYEALSAWMELADKPSTDNATQEALLAVPYTLEKLDAREMALSRYEKAIAVYEHQLVELDDALKTTQNGEFIRALHAASYRSNVDWTHEDEPMSGLPAAKYWRDLLASRKFQQAYRDYRDLLHLQRTALRWQEQIPNLQMMLTSRRQNYYSKLPLIQEQARLDRLNKLRRRRDVLAATLKDIASRKDAEGLADPNERKLVEKLRGLITRLDDLRSHGNDVSAEMRRAAILYGLMLWRLDSDYPARLWQVKKDLNQVDDALEQATLAKSSLESAWRNAPSGFVGFNGRITKLETDLVSLGKRIDSAIFEQERRITSLASDTITLEKDQVQTYRLRAHYALARLNDALIHEKNPP